MITRNNYEEFFLLYVDNEMSPADRQAVERFVDEHPDLKEELELLLQCRISPDEMPSFSGKEQLLRSASLINLNNYETWFLLYIDNELDTSSRQAVIDFVRQHPEKNIEWQQLQRTVSTPDLNIVFPDKELLYRREETPARSRKIAWLPFARIAAAALIIGAVGLLIFRPFSTDPRTASGSNNSGTVARSNSDTAPGVAKTSDAQHSGSVAHQGSDRAATVAQSASDSSATANPGPGQSPVLASAAPANEKKRTAPVTPRTIHPYYIPKKGDNKSTPTGDETTAPVTAQVDPIRPTQADPARSAKVDPARTAQTVDTDPGHEVAVVVPKTIDRNAKIPVTMTAAGDQTQHDAPGNTNASFARQALLGQVSYSDDGSPEEMISPRKNKLRGIFRKVTRVLEKPAAREDDDNKKVTIGGFQFALK